MYMALLFYYSNVAESLTSQKLYLCIIARLDSKQQFSVIYRMKTVSAKLQIISSHQLPYLNFVNELKLFGKVRAKRVSVTKVEKNPEKALFRPLQMLYLYVCRLSPPPPSPSQLSQIVPRPFWGMC